MTSLHFNIIVGIGDWGLGIAIPNPQSPIPYLI